MHLLIHHMRFYTFPSADPSAPQLLPAENACPFSVVEIQTRLLAELENKYWRKHFAHRPYYVAGRSYDQYQPAYELGWLNAILHPHSSFDTLEAHLAQQWSSQRSTSLLPWNEVSSAVQDAWQHALLQQQAWRTPAEPTTSMTPEMAKMLQSLYRRCVQLSGELARLAPMQASDFLIAVIHQHARLFRSFSRRLAKLSAMPRPSLSLSHRLVHKVRRHWSSMQSQFLEADPESLLMECEQKERELLQAYQRACEHKLPADIHDILQQQTLQLRQELEKLRLARTLRDF